MNNGVETNDKSVVLSDELFEIFGTSAPGGNARINSTKTRQVSTGYIYCTGDVNVEGRFRTPIRAGKGVIMPAGSASAPGIVIGSAGLYGNGSAIATTGALQLGGALTTTSGNLMLNPAGSAVDFMGKSIINATGGTIPTIGDPNDVIVNDSLGALTSEPQLLPQRGGTGVDTSADTGIPRIVAGTWSVGALSGDDFGGTLELDSLTVSGPIATIDGPIVQQLTNNLGASGTYVMDTVSIGSAPEVLFSFPATLGAHTLACYSLRGLITASEMASKLFATITFVAGAKNDNGTITTTGPVNVVKIIDGPSLVLDVSMGVDGANVVVLGVGPGEGIIHWCIRLDIVSLLD